MLLSFDEVEAGKLIAVLVIHVSVDKYYRIDSDHQKQWRKFETTDRMFGANSFLMAPMWIIKVENGCPG